MWLCNSGVLHGNETIVSSSFSSTTHPAGMPVIESTNDYIRHCAVVSHSNVECKCIPGAPVCWAGSTLTDTGFNGGGGVAITIVVSSMKTGSRRIVFSIPTFICILLPSFQHQVCYGKDTSDGENSIEAGWCWRGRGCWSRCYYRG